MKKTGNRICGFRKKTLCLAVVTALAISPFSVLSGCGSAETSTAVSNTTSSGLSQTASSEILDDSLLDDSHVTYVDVQETPGIDEFVEKLSAVEGLSDVHKDEFGFVTGYIEQPLDWQTDTGKTFKQQFSIDFKGADLPVCYSVGGYSLMTSMSDYSLFPEDYAHNAVRIEYRFFGESRPEGLDNDSVDMWEYLTVENAAEDIHSLISKISTVLTGKRVMTGASKGGFTTNYQAYKYPEDADLFIPFCAPLCDSASDTRMYDFLNYSVGDDVIGTEKAAEARGAILDFQVECMRYKNDLKSLYKASAIELNAEGENGYRSHLLEDDGAKLYDTAVADLPGCVWSSLGNYPEYATADQLISYFGDIVAMPVSTDEEVSAKKEAILNALSAFCSPGGYACSDDTNMLPYIIQSLMQMGNYEIDLTPLRERIAEEQAKDPSFPDLSFTVEEEKTAYITAFLTDEQIELGSQFSFVHDELVEWEKTTNANVLMVFGGVDPWTSVAIPECDNPSVKRILVKSSDVYEMIGHSASVSTFDEESMNTIYDALNELK